MNGRELTREKVLLFTFDASVPIPLRDGISRAVFDWAEHLCLKPVLTCGGDTRQRCLRFRIAQGDHGDGFPFVSGGSKISHVVSKPTRIATPEIHLNSEIAWKTDGSDPDVYTVALHEIGHALGLAHSSDQESIMYSWYGRGRRILDSELPPAVRFVNAIEAESLPIKIESCASFQLQ